ncbi:class Ib ribonucleoside-diphosphate reductase assembly flavoprotein NrdI [Paenibacillus albiflavus]|uniref:Protein NrdI n=1 Tax=Paenibacillus albiflavus TaxID=2545760 RepID=A0A4R4EJG8_9BACL|nr:class Ib ribonucleoside-diphosphate reductase assembly flavoprotein NrdI [Paenibacillus albiflavus]TCZ80109.1 class Ib ribonucleoside-diphosphate reductase assembly flavoprotein NrdI [Paenibacillus albiflavus]
MLIVYDSKTGNVKRFIQKLDMKCVQITPDLEIDEPYVLVTYTTGFGQAPQATQNFLATQGHLLQAVVSSGNMNWGTRYGLAADHIARQYEVPILMKFELSGTNKDVMKFKQEVSQIVYNRKVDSA